MQDKMLEPIKYSRDKKYEPEGKTKDAKIDIETSFKQTLELSLTWFKNEILLAMPTATTKENFVKKDERWTVRDLCLCLVGPGLGYIRGGKYMTIVTSNMRLEQKQGSSC